MRQFAATANIYRARIGDDAALTAAQLLAAEIENPALSTMLAGPPAGLAVHIATSRKPNVPAASSTA